MITPASAAAAGLPPFIELVDRGVIRVYDLIFIRKDLGGAVVQVDLADVGQHGQPELLAFAGASSGLLDQEDIDAAAEFIEAGNSAALIVYENRCAEPLSGVIRRSGGRLAASQRIAPEALLAALATQPN
jgi:Family of unknown function (DUF6325)